MSRYLIAVCLITVAAAQSGRGVNFYSLEKEVALGRQIANEFTRENPILESPEVVQCVQRLGDRLVAETGGPPFTYRYALVADSPAFNEIVAIPGGFVFVPTSIILAAHDEDEFVGVLAHAIGHIANRDGSRQATKAELVNVASVPLIYMGGWSGYAMRQGASLAIPLGFLQFWRKMELEDDGLAARKMAALGYDPAALARFIDRTQAAYDQYRNRVTSPLPLRTERIAAIQEVIASLPAQSYSPHTGFDRIQDDVRRLAPAATPVPPHKAPSLGK